MAPMEVLEALPNIGDGLGGPPGGAGWVGRLSRRFEMDREAILEVRVTPLQFQNVLEGPAGYQGRVGSPSQKFGWPYLRFEMGREAIPEVREILPEVPDGSGGPSRGPGCGRKAFPETRDGL